MNTLIEQRIWDYIDGNLSEAENKEITILIETNPEYQLVYSQLIDINSSLNDMELDEPSMGFTRSVVEKISLSPVPGSVKSMVDKRIIGGLASFFVLTIFGLLAYAIFNFSGQTPGYKTEIEVQWANFNGFQSPDNILGFIFLDAILGLYLLDGWLRRKMFGQLLNKNKFVKTI